MKKFLVLGLILSFALAPCAWAGNVVSVTVSINQKISVSVTPGAHDFGASAESQVLSTAADAITATNDGNTKEKFSISVANSENWEAVNTAAAIDKFVMSFTTDGSVWNKIDPSPASSSLAAAVNAGAVQKFGLQLSLPTATNFGGAVQTIPVTVTASL